MTSEAPDARAVPPGAPIVLFWSWQDDSPSETNREFVFDCLKRAAKELRGEAAIFVEVDRDTKGVGGAPAIADTILAKVAMADVFVYDASLAYSAPRAAPNPNVMFELGYAVAAMGFGRTIGVMNVYGLPGPEKLPFDLRHRRFPITYSLRGPGQVARAVSAVSARFLARFHARRARARKELTADLKAALRDALKEPRVGIADSLPDFRVAKALWAKLNSLWFSEWRYVRNTMQQYEYRANGTALNDYRHIVKAPEFKFDTPALGAAHEELLKAISKYLGTIAIEMVPEEGNPEMLVVKAKRYGRDHDEDYDRAYEYEVDRVNNAGDALWEAWGGYTDQLKRCFPDIVWGEALKSQVSNGGSNP